MNLVYVSKNSWWDSRKARKVLLPLAVSALPNMQVLLVNAAQPLWVANRRPKLWLHPETGMQVLSPCRFFPLQRFALMRRLNQWLRWRAVCRQLPASGDTDRSGRIDL